MKILIVNPIIYTCETNDIKKVNSIKDTMIYDLCLGFKDIGVSVTLAASDKYMPTQKEEYPFDVLWLKTSLTGIFPPNTLPFCPDVVKTAKNGNYDLIITSEVFSLNSLALSIRCKKNLIVWHELAKHNRMMHGIPSKIWYGIVARIFFKNTMIVARSKQAKDFISCYCRNVSDIVIDHGVNLDKFTPCTQKENYFCVSSQLISRKRIDGIIEKFADYLKKYDENSCLYIMGNGEEEENLKELTVRLGVENSVIFTGNLPHTQLIEILKKAKAMLVNTEKDNNMVSVVESIALATPVITTSVPYNSSYIRENELGIVSDGWGASELLKIQDSKYVDNCLAYRPSLGTQTKAQAFIDMFNKN